MPVGAVPQHVMKRGCPGFPFLRNFPAPAESAASHAVSDGPRNRQTCFLNLRARADMASKPDSIKAALAGTGTALMVIPSMAM